MPRGSFKGKSMPDMPENTAVSCATMAEQIWMLFGLWTRPWMAQGSMCYMDMECTLAQPGEYD